MVTRDSLPENLESEKDQEKYCKEKIKETYAELNKASKTATSLQVELGQWFSTLKTVVKKDGKMWKAYVKKSFPYMTIRTVQRWMKLGRAVDIESHPRLAYADQTRLLALVSIANREKTEVHSLLKDNQVSLKFKPKKGSEIKEFKDSIDDLIKQKRSSIKKAPATNTMMKRLCKNVSELGRKLEVEEDTEAINKTIVDQSIDELEELLEQLREIRKRLKKKSKRKMKRAA